MTLEKRCQWPWGRRSDSSNRLPEMAVSSSHGFSSSRDGFMNHLLLAYHAAPPCFWFTTTYGVRWEERTWGRRGSDCCPQYCPERNAEGTTASNLTSSACFESYTYRSCSHRLMVTSFFHAQGERGLSGNFYKTEIMIFFEWLLKLYVICASVCVLLAALCLSA